MQIRPAVFSDIPEIVDVHISSWMFAYRELMSDTYLQGITKEDWQKDYEKYFNDPENAPTNFLLLTENEEVIGFIDGEKLKDNTYLITSLYLHPQHVRK